MGTVACCSAVATCLVIELILLFSALSVSVGGFGSGLLYQGNCNKVKSLTVWLLFPLNIAATVLISSSNYVMQVMAAPDRKEVDYAHSLATSITIGGMRVRNLQFGGRRRRFIWWLLGLSSLPIHVFLNSAIYGSVQASNSGILVVSDDFQSDKNWGLCNSTTFTGTKTSDFACSLKRDFDAGKTVRMSPQQCLHQYASGFQTNATSAIIVTKTSSSHYFSLPNPGFVGMVTEEVGIACEQNGTAHQYTPIPPSQRQFKLDFDADAGNAQASIPFLMKCTNNTKKPDGNRNWTLEAGKQGPTIYSTNSSLFLTEEDPLVSISSVRSAFSAFEYRYWATARLLNYDLNSPDLTFASEWDSRAWLCPESDLARGVECDPTQLNVKNSEWLITPSSIPVTECYVLPTKEQCALRYSTSILLIAIGTDIVKLAAMFMALRLTVEPLATIGDAIESFLQTPDTYTKDLCMLDADSACTWSKKAAPRVKDIALKAALSQIPAFQDKARSGLLEQADLELYHTAMKATRSQVYDGATTASGSWKPVLFTHMSQEECNWSKYIPGPPTGAWVQRAQRWYVVPSKSRWTCYMIFFATLAIPTSLLFAFGLEALRKQRIADFWTVGLNGPDPAALFTGGVMNVNSILWTALVINLPQLLFSMLYFLFNALVTMMHTAHEWSAFARQRKALRVSNPRGRQRSTYWLQLPWSYSGPLIVASGTLHWLLGRSVYIVKVDVYGFFGDREADKDFFACGYSPLTILGLVVVLGIMILALAGLSLRRLNRGSPVVKLNSLAIAAACHGDLTEEGLVARPLMWGVIRDDQGADTVHCSFSARNVSPLMEGMVYH